MAPVELVGAAVAIVVDTVARFVRGLDATGAIAPLGIEFATASANLRAVDTSADAAPIGWSDEARLHVSRPAPATFVDRAVAIVIDAVAMVGRLDLERSDATSLHECWRLTERGRACGTAEPVSASACAWRRSARHCEVQTRISAVLTGRGATAERARLAA
jgi:hypothetical protein